MTSDLPLAPPVPGGHVPALVLTGGGARSAYQVGVLKAVAELLPEQRNPFPVILGTSAGAVAASVLGARANDWHQAVAAIEHVWANFHVGQVFHVSRRKMLRAGVRWMLSLLSGGLLVRAPRSLFDNTPLRQLLTREVRWRGVGRNVRAGNLAALALCATGYGTARSVAYFEGDEARKEWSRRHHVGRRARLALPHLMASLSVPMLFPPELIDDEYFGDGAMRQLSPLSPALHLGANRLLVIGVRGAAGGGVVGFVAAEVALFLRVAVGRGRAIGGVDGLTEDGAFDEELVVDDAVHEAQRHLAACRVGHHLVLLRHDDARISRVPFIRHENAPVVLPLLSIRYVDHHLRDRFVEHAAVELQHQFVA